MKYVREHINEKFSEEGDPINDMGIGIKNIVDDFKKRLGMDGWSLFRYEIAQEKDIELAKGVMNYLLKNKQINFNDKYVAEDLIRVATRNEMRHFLVEKAVEYKAKTALAEFLIQASKWNDTELVSKLLEGGADPRIRGNKPMMLAVKNRNKKLWDLMEPYIKWKT